ncbi:hypothetical protein ACFV2B_26720 [Streptomyces lavendulae]|uniref:hypothetical protein n=1 Tax=Streptomyces lavendulae TaxID=1914 RepID=UPI00369B19E5
MTHDIDEALALAGRVVVLGGSPGRVLADHPVPPGTPDPALRESVAAHLTTP